MVSPYEAPHAKCKPAAMLVWEGHMSGATLKGGSQLFCHGCCRDRSSRRSAGPSAGGRRYNAESALDSLLDDLQEFRAESARPAPPASSELTRRISCFCPRICIVSMLPSAPSGASVPVCHGYGHVALELVCREPNHEVLSLVLGFLSGFSPALMSMLNSCRNNSNHIASWSLLDLVPGACTLSASCNGPDHGTGSEHCAWTISRRIWGADRWNCRRAHYPW